MECELSGGSEGDGRKQIGIRLSKAGRKDEDSDSLTTGLNGSRKINNLISRLP